MQLLQYETSKTSCLSYCLCLGPEQWILVVGHSVQASLYFLSVFVCFACVCWHFIDSDSVLELIAVLWSVFVAIKKKKKLILWCDIILA